MSRRLVCLECWRDFESDPLHLDCTGEHVVLKSQADEAREWINGRRAFMAHTGQRQQFEGWRYISAQ